MRGRSLKVWHEPTEGGLHEYPGEATADEKRHVEAYAYASVSCSLAVIARHK